MVRSLRIRCLDELAGFARGLATTLGPGMVLALEGPLGAGKTELVRQIVAALGRDPGQVTSPSFSLVNVYEGHPRIYHIDLYRISGRRELEGLDLEEPLADPEGVCFIEWPAVARDLLPPGTVQVTIAVEPDGTRRFDLAGPIPEGSS